MGKSKLILCWSSGKDSAWALHRLRQQNDFDIVGLLTTINEAAARVAMHAVRESLLDRQAEAAGLPLLKVSIPHPCPNEIYEERMTEAVAETRKIGVEAFAFGDLFLEDVRRYREDNLAGTGIEPVFPLWGLNTSDLAREMVASGLAARVTCVDPKTARSGLRRPRIRRGIPQRSTRRCRPLRRERRVSQLRPPGPDVRPPDRHHLRRDRRARRIRLRGSAAGVARKRQALAAISLPIIVIPDSAKR